jgi:hypothetical protein
LRLSDETLRAAKEALAASSQVLMTEVQSLETDLSVTRTDLTLALSGKQSKEGRHAEMQRRVEKLIKEKQTVQQVGLIVYLCGEQFCSLLSKSRSSIKHSLSRS